MASYRLPHGWSKRVEDSQESEDELEDFDELQEGQEAVSLASSQYKSQVEEEQKGWQPETPPLPPQSPILSSPLKRRAGMPATIAHASSATSTLSEPLRSSSVEVSSPILLSFPSRHEQTSVLVSRDGESGHGQDEEEDDEGDRKLSRAEPDLPRKSLFDIEDEEETQRIDEMYALLTAANQDPDSDADSNESDAAYETRRNKKLLENQRLLAQLGLGPSGPAEDGPSLSPHPSASLPRGGSPNGTITRRSASFEPEKPKSKSRRRRGLGERKALKLAEDGTTTTLPLPDTVHELAYVDILPVRERARDEHIYVDHFLVQAPVPTPPPTPVQTPVRSSRIPRNKEIDTATQKNKLTSTTRGRVDVVGKGSFRRSRAEMAELEPDKASLGTTCHQCRRKTVDVKMFCRQVGFMADTAAMQCLLQYCQYCLQARYGIGTSAEEESWDPSSLNWVCPRCRGICNCTICMQKAGLSNCIPHQIGPGGRTITLSSLLKDKSGKVKYRSVKHYLEAVNGVTQIGPRRILATEEESKEIRDLLTSTARLRTEVKMIQERRMRRLSARALREVPMDRGGQLLDTEESRDGSPPITKCLDGALHSRSERVAKRVPRASQPPKRVLKLRKPVGLSASDAPIDLGRSPTAVAILAWQNSLGGNNRLPHSVKDAQKQGSFPKAHSLSKDSLRASESHVWIKGEADRYESSSESDMLGDSVEEETLPRQRGLSEQSSLTSLSDTMSWRRDSGPLNGETGSIEAAEARESKGTEAGQGPERDATEEVATAAGEANDTSGLAGGLIPNLAYSNVPILSSSMPMDAPSSSAQRRSGGPSNLLLPELTYRSEPDYPLAHDDEQGRGEDLASGPAFAPSSRSPPSPMLSFWHPGPNTNPYSAQGQGESMDIINSFSAEAAAGTIGAKGPASASSIFYGPAITQHAEDGPSSLTSSQREEEGKGGEERETEGQGEGEEMCYLGSPSYPFPPPWSSVARRHPTGPIVTGL